MAITTSYRTRSDAVPLRSFKAKGRPSAIAGVGVYAPEKVITNFDLEKMMDTSDKWITERTGIRRRHIAEPGTTTFEVATRAAQSALDAAGITARDLDMILVGTSSPDGPFPSVACRDCAIEKWASTPTGRRAKTSAWPYPASPSRTQDCVPTRSMNRAKNTVPALDASGNRGLVSAAIPYLKSASDLRRPK